MGQIMHREHLQYLYQYMTKFKSGFFTAIIRQISYIFLNYTQRTRGAAEKMPLYNLPHRTQVMITIKNEIPLKIRQGTVFHFRINTNFAC